MRVYRAKRELKKRMDKEKADKEKALPTRPRPPGGGGPVVSATAPGSPEIRDYLLRRMPDTQRAPLRGGVLSDDTLLDRIESEEDLARRRLRPRPPARTPSGTSSRSRCSTRPTTGTASRRRAASSSSSPRSGSSARRRPPRPAARPPAPGLAPLSRRDGDRPSASASSRLLAIASLASAWFLKSALSRTRRELAARAAARRRRRAGGRRAARPDRRPRARPGRGPVDRAPQPAAPGARCSSSSPRASLAPQAVAFERHARDGGQVAWDSGELPAKERRGRATSRSVCRRACRPRAATRSGSGRAGRPARPQDSFLGTLDIVER